MTFSVMIMSHDNHEMLRQCLKNLKEFTPFDYKVVIVDDMSETPYNVEGATIVRMPQRSDCCNLRNVGMEMSKSDYVFWVDNDCFVGPDWYKPMLEVIEGDERVGLTGQPMNGRMIRNPFFPINQADCMIEDQFAYDFDHNTNLCDHIMSYCVLVKKEAYRPIYCHRMPTPFVDPELGTSIKINGYKVKVANRNSNLHHIGSATPREGGRDYLYHLAESFANWFRFWKPHASKVFELYSGREIKYDHNAQEPSRPQSKGQHGDLDKGDTIYE